MLQKISLGIIKIFRFFLVHTPVNNWNITGKIKGLVFRSAYRDKELQIHFKGVEIIAPARDVALVPGLVGNYYESFELDLYSAIASESNTIIDVGGNIGLYAVIGAKNLPQNGRIISFEPIDENINFLKRNAVLNKVDSKIELVESAIGADDREIQIYTSAINVGNHSFAQKNAGKSSVPVTVPQTSVDNYVDRSKVKTVDLLKIDIEGYDGFALEGSMDTIEKHIPTLFIEFIPQSLENCDYDPQTFIQLLAKHYSSCYIVNEVSKTVNKIVQAEIPAALHNIKSANLILCSRIEHSKILEEFFDT